MTNRMPGFTADDGHYAATRSYRTSRGTNTGLAGVIPSLRAPGGGRGCIPGCICVTPEGCPCCDSIYKAPMMAFRDGGTPAPVMNAGVNAGSLVDTVDAWCTAHGGGMASMADGTVQCFL